MFNDVVHAYEQLCELLHFDKGGTLLCPGLAGADDLENHQEFLEKAVKMGMAIQFINRLTHPKRKAVLYCDLAAV